MTSMTWEQFAAKVEQQLIELGTPRTIELQWINWDRDGFGGIAIPDVYVNVLTDKAEPRLAIGED